MPEYNTPASGTNAPALAFDFPPAVLMKDQPDNASCVPDVPAEEGRMAVSLAETDLAHAAAAVSIVHALPGFHNKHTCATPDCRASFKNGKTLEEHALKFKHKAFQCQCNRAYTKLSSLDRHVKEALDLRKHRCPFCNDSFKRPAHLHTHVRTIHKRTRDDVQALANALKVSEPRSDVTAPWIDAVGGFVHPFDPLPQNDLPMMGYGVDVGTSGWNGASHLPDANFGSQPLAFAGITEAMAGESFPAGPFIPVGSVAHSLPNAYGSPNLMGSLSFSAVGTTCPSFPIGSQDVASYSGPFDSAFYTGAGPASTAFTQTHIRPVNGNAFSPSGGLFGDSDSYIEYPPAGSLALQQDGGSSHPIENNFGALTGCSLGQSDPVHDYGIWMGLNDEQATVVGHDEVLGGCVGGAFM